MALVRHYLDKLMLSTLDKEASYDAGPSSWTTGVQSFKDFDDASGHEEFADMVQGDTDVVTGFEFPSVQEIPRQGVTLAYTETRVKPNTLAGLMGLTLGTITSTQDGILDAYRHRISPSSSVALPSIGAQTLRDGGVQRQYTGIKSNGFTLASNGAYVRFSCNMVGSGTRPTAADTFPAPVEERWLRWGDAKLYIKDTGGTPIATTLTTPSQSGANLGGSEVNISTRTLDFSSEFMNNLSVDNGYRASTGLVRGNFHPDRRTSTFQLTFEVDTATEATELNYYLTQAKLALELNINSGTLVAATGAFNYGAIVILPRVQLTSIPRGQNQNLETLRLVGNVLDDGTNPTYLSFVYDAIPAYLA